MRVISLIATILWICTMGLEAQSRRELKAMYHSAYSYELMPLGVGQDGTKAIKVWSYGKNAEVAAFNARRDAVAAVLFRGIPGGNGAAPTPPIIGIDGYEKNEVFFDEFFKAGGMYLNFINLTANDVPSGEDRIKTERGYKVAIYASVNFDALRKYMEEKGLSRRLDAGF